MDDAEAIAGLMALSETCPGVQIDQTRFRLRLVRGWGIPEGARVLEVGCGQGDMTAALAHAVGSSGRVTAIDSADPDYGSPVTVGKSAEHLSETSLGARIEFHYDFDLLDEAVDFPADSFDYVVFAHCSWYFGSLDALRRSLARVQPWARRLCYSEWDLEPRSLDQVPHLLAVLIRGQVEAHRTDSEANVRTPTSKARLLGLLAETGWGATSEESIGSDLMEDGRWEIEGCLASAIEEAANTEMEPRLADLLASQVDLLGLLAEKHGYRSLPSYSILAGRSPGPIAENPRKHG